MKTVFVSGPMRSIPRAEGIAWRKKAQELLEEKFKVLSAYRGREEKESFPDPKGAIIRDKQDIEKSDIVIVNDTISQASMIGTSMEVLFAFEHNKPIIIFGDAHKGDYWLDYHATIRVGTLEEACQLCLSLFHD